MTIDKIETVRTLLKYTGDSNEQRDAVIRGAITILQGELSDVGTVGTEQKTEPKPKKAEQKKDKPKQGGRPPFDTGKMKACLKAGRSVAWIADEMGVSEPTIRKYMKQEGLA